jgi:uncharacterized membrane protein
VSRGDDTRAARRRAEQEARRAERRQREAEARVPQTLAGPDLALLLPALAGVALAGYLTAVDWSGATPVACAPGSGCDVVQGSRWGSFLGVPTAAWGLLAYLALVAVAVAVRRLRLHAALALAIAGPGLAVSLYLTAVSLLAIGATCLWCLASLALMGACFAAAWARRPRPPARTLPPAWLGAIAAAAVVTVAGLHLHYQGVFDPDAGPEDPRLRALAEHLDAIDARFYGASWCPHCTDQKALFGASADRLPYVECSPEGPRTPQAPACRDAGIDSYPTWIIEGERHSGLLRPDELARLSGFREPSALPDRGREAGPGSG